MPHEKVLCSSFMALLGALIGALDLRDAETQWHSRRVALYTKHLAEACGIVGDELVHIEYGALLHDVGKIGIKDSVLLKPSPLTSEEWAEMKRHPVLGWSIIHTIPELQYEAKFILQHQERWDGSGYPHGLKGDQICMGARIFSLVDCIDAITTDRPYRLAKDFLTASQEIIRCSGTQFDPKIVSVFAKIPTHDWVNIKRSVEDKRNP